MKGAPCHVLLQVGGPTPISGSADEIRLFSKCRNELVRLPAFFRHYRKLGVRRFFIVDNASTDGTTEYLAEQPDTVVFRTDGAFREARGGTDWLNAVLSRFGVGHWCVTVDIDELLYFPGSEGAGLPAVTAHMDRRGEQAMACLLLDMYPNTPLRDVAYHGGDLVEAAPYFDSGPYVRFDHSECPWFRIYGGVRERVFYPEVRADDLKRRLHVRLYHRVLLKIPRAGEIDVVREHRPLFSPCLTKVPLVKWRSDTRYLNVNHFVSPCKLSGITGALLHFKLMMDFHARAVEEVARGQYYDGAVEFQRYAEKLRENPDVTLMDGVSVRFQSSEQLTRMGLVQDTTDWASERRAETAGARA